MQEGLRYGRDNMTADVWIYTFRLKKSDIQDCYHLPKCITHKNINKSRQMLVFSFNSYMIQFKLFKQNKIH